MDEIKRGDRVRRKSGGPTGTVVSVFTAWDGKGTRRARVHWEAQANGRRRIGGGKDAHGYIAVASLVRVTE